MTPAKPPLAALVLATLLLAAPVRADDQPAAPNVTQYTAGDPYNGRRPLAWTMLVFAGLSGAGGYGFQRAHDRHVADRDRDCPAGAAMRAAVCDTLDTQVERSRKLQLTGYIAGGAFTLLAVYLFATDMGEDTGFAFAPVGDRGGIAWSGRF